MALVYFTGSIPLRQLVYRVHPLPESMRPLVWDFGQLKDDIEKLYTAKIVRGFVTTSTQVVSIMGVSWQVFYCTVKVGPTQYR